MLRKNDSKPLHEVELVKHLTPCTEISFLSLQVRGSDCCSADHFLEKVFPLEEMDISGKGFRPRKSEACVSWGVVKVGCEGRNGRMRMLNA